MVVMRGQSQLGSGDSQNGRNSLSSRSRNGSRSARSSKRKESCQFESPVRPFSSTVPLQRLAKRARLYDFKPKALNVSLPEIFGEGGGASTRCCLMRETQRKQEHERLIKSIQVLENSIKSFNSRQESTSSLDATKRAEITQEHLTILDKIRQLKKQSQMHYNFSPDVTETTEEYFLKNGTKTNLATQPQHRLVNSASAESFFLKHLHKKPSQSSPTSFSSKRATVAPTTLTHSCSVQDDVNGQPLPFSFGDGQLCSGNDSAPDVIWGLSSSEDKEIEDMKCTSESVLGLECLHLPVLEFSTPPTSTSNSSSNDIEEVSLAEDQQVMDIFNFDDAGSRAGKTWNGRRAFSFVSPVNSVKDRAKSGPSHVRAATLPNLTQFSDSTNASRAEYMPPQMKRGASRQTVFEFKIDVTTRVKTESRVDSLELQELDSLESMLLESMARLSV